MRKKKTTQAVGEAPAEALSASTPAPVFHFTSDYRETNPGLHRLYLGYALQEIETIHRFVQEMRSLSRAPATEFVADVQSRLRRMVLTDAAWFEAQALFTVGIDSMELSCLENGEELDF